VQLHRPIVQIAYIVPDVRAAAQQWVDRVGAGPFYVFDHFELTATHRGEPAVLDHSPAFGQWGSVQVELIQLHELEPAAFREAFGGGKFGLHHMTWFPDDLDAEGARLEQLGWPCVLDMTGSTGTRALFHDARAELGHFIELYVATPQIRRHYDRVAQAAQGWDGRDPIREYRTLVEV
jgi:Glyoxalase/Bleomycin resistance protein/Dioxygenase superfamily